MKKEYIFVVLIIAMLYMIYLVLDEKYEDYQINSNNEYLAHLRDTLSEKIQEAEEIIEYKSTSAYKNKILKEHQGMKNKGEQVVTLITEKKYEKYTKETPIESDVIDIPLTNEESLISTMTIYQKWKYFLLQKDTR